MTKKRIQRVTDWDNARYSIIPARVAIDERMQLTHFRILAYLGRCNSQGGWCEFSQKAAAGVLHIGRQAVNGAVSDLVEWGILEKRGQKETKSALCQYRVRIDDEAPEDVSPADDTPRVASGRHTCPPRATHVSPASSDTLLRSKIKDQKDRDFGFEKKKSAVGGTPRNTDEPFAEYRERMIREGKFDPKKANAT